MPNTSVPINATTLPRQSMHGRIPANAVSTTRVFPIDLIAAAARHGGAPFDAAEQAAAMNAVLVSLNALPADARILPPEPSRKSA